MANGDSDDSDDIMKLGPVGVFSFSRSHDKWDHKGCNKIIQIFISHDDGGINSFQYQYEQNGVLMMSQRYGQIAGVKFDVVTLNHPTEYITSLSGHWTSSNSKYDIISSLSFSTNIKKYSPLGRCFTGYGKEFRFHVGEYAQFWGFHGSSDSCGLKSIGIYLKPNTSLPTTLGHNVVVPKKEA